MISKQNKLTIKTTILALGLMIGCFGLLGGSVSAGSVTTNIELKPTADYIFNSDIDGPDILPDIYSQGEVKISDMGAIPNIGADPMIMYFWNLNLTECQMKGAQSFEYRQSNGPFYAGIGDSGGIYSGLSNNTATDNFTNMITGVSPTVVSSNGTPDGSGSWVESLASNGDIAYTINTGTISGPISVGYLAGFDNGDDYYINLSRPTLTLTYDDSACPKASTPPVTISDTITTPTLPKTGDNQTQLLTLATVLCLLGFMSVVRLKVKGEEG